MRRLIAAEDLYAGEHWTVARGLPDLSGRARITAMGVLGWLRPHPGRRADPPLRGRRSAADRIGCPAAPTARARGGMPWPRGKDPSRGSRAASAPWPPPTRPPASCWRCPPPTWMPAATTSSPPRREVPDPDQLHGHICRGPAARACSPRLMVPADARLQAVLGGTRQALNARIAAHLLSAGITGRADATRHLAQLLAEPAASPPLRAEETQRRGGQRDDQRPPRSGTGDVGQQAAARVPRRRIRLRAAAVRATAPAGHRRRDGDRPGRGPRAGQAGTADHPGPHAPLYMFTLTAGEILQVADISRVSRDDLGELIGYQRPEVRQHIQEITDYLDSDQPLFPNPIIIALPSTVRFTCSRGTERQRRHRRQRDPGDPAAERRRAQAGLDRRRPAARLRAGRGEAAGLPGPGQRLRRRLGGHAA